MSIDLESLRVRCIQLTLVSALVFAPLAGQAQSLNTLNAIASFSEEARQVFLDAEAARAAGDPEKEVVLLEETLGRVGASSQNAYPVYERLRHNYADRGLFAQALEVGQRQLQVAGGPGQEHSVLVSMVGMYSALHQMEKASAAANRIEQLMPRLRTSRNWASRGNWWQSGLAQAKAHIHMRSGHLAEAEEALKTCISSSLAAIRDDPVFDGSVQYLGCIQGLMDIQIMTGQLAAAGELADQLRLAAERTLALKKRPAIHLRVKQITGRLALEQGKTELSRQILTDGIASLQASNSADLSLRAADLRAQLARIEMLLGHWDKALDWHQQRAAALEGSGEARGRVPSGSVEYAYTLLRLGQATQALEMLEKITAMRIKSQDDNSLFRWESEAFLGVALAAAGRRDEAMQKLRLAIPRYLDISKSERSSAEAGVMRTARLNWLLDGYLALLSDYASGMIPGQTDAAMDEAFRMADLARGSTVQRALSISASRASISDPALADLARREQDLQREISALAESIGNLLSRGRVAEQDKVVSEMRATLARLSGEHNTAQSEIERRFPGYAALLNPKPVGIAAVQKLLKPSEALISIYAGSEHTLIWAIPGTGPAHFAIAPLTREQLDLKVATLRKALDPNAEAAGRLPRFNFDVAYELYSRLLAPVEFGWKGAQELIVIPHGKLGQLPFGVLITQPWKAPAARLAYAELADAPWLIKQVALSQLPAAIALPALRAQGKVLRGDRPFIGFGDPLFVATAASTTTPVAQSTRGIKRRNLVVAGVTPTPSSPAASTDLGSSINFKLLPQLPDTAQEIEEVAAVLAADQTRDVFLHSRASEAQVKHTDLSPYRVVMFATHGLMNGEMPGLYQPALALSNPALSGDGEDGMLTMEEILSLKLRADWVVLSACNTAAAGGQSNESVSGLGRAFFYAGARSLLVTNWAVETESARMLTTETFRLQSAHPELPRAQALQQSSLTLMKKSAGKDYSYAHPMFWAPYSLVGDGGQ
ncbi:MAG: CHAT domain-containing protein [Betaproteobacteria bacterium]